VALRKLMDLVIACNTPASAKEAPALLSSALYVGTVQACLGGSYWAPEFGVPGATRVLCHHLSNPVSCCYRIPPSQQLLPKRKPPSCLEWPGFVTCEADRHPLDVASKLYGDNPELHIAVIRFTSTHDLRNKIVANVHRTSEQTMLRTTYPQALGRMECELQASVADTLSDGAIIYTSDVGILRGPIKEGAAWARKPAKVDVIWIPVDGFPQKGEAKLHWQDWYGLESDEALLRSTLDLSFSWAAARGCDVLVMPPVGCSSHACGHPPLGVARVIYEVSKRYATYLPKVYVASDCKASQSEWWDDFTAVANGRPKPDAYVQVPPIPLPPWVLARKAAAASPGAPFSKTSPKRPGATLAGNRPRSLGATAGGRCMLMDYTGRSAGGAGYDR